jgi:hypothetical protein
VKDFNGYSGFWRQGLNVPILQAEVGGPSLRARIEKQNKLPGEGIERSNVGAFVPVTSHASQGQVVFSCWAVMLPGDDVIWLVPVNGKTFG